ncbi:hypothetical protein TNCV_3386111 [Trichonephila clavipes]|nr:hypothetical protein TNCV_3386111 [Trichonephila clavipes]
MAGIDYFVKKFQPIFLIKLGLDSDEHACPTGSGSRKLKCAWQITPLGDIPQYYESMLEHITTSTGTEGCQCFIDFLVLYLSYHVRRGCKNDFGNLCCKADLGNLLRARRTILGDTLHHNTNTSVCVSGWSLFKQYLQKYGNQNLRN